MRSARHGKGPPPPDFLVCFPSRPHLTLMPKPICSPARPSTDPPTRRRRIRKSGGFSRGHGSPLFRAKSKAHHNSDIISEPTSPKVTCAGQIKVSSKSKPTSCKNWQSVMEEIERMHKKKKRSPWIEALGFKKDVTQFLTCLRNIRFDFRCFGAFPAAEITTDEEEEEEDDDEIEEGIYRRRSGLREEIDSDSDSRAVFSKWFMILQENQGNEFVAAKEEIGKPETCDDADCTAAEVVPPPNALLLMRCRSAPTNRSMVMNCGSDLSISGEIAKETWIVEGIDDLLSRNRSCGR